MHIDTRVDKKGRILLSGSLSATVIRMVSASFVLMIALAGKDLRLRKVQSMRASMT